MARTPTCDQRDCPAPALRHIELHGQDFHFCNHHWRELPAMVPTSRVAKGAALHAGAAHSDRPLASAAHRERS